MAVYNVYYIPQWYNFTKQNERHQAQGYMVMEIISNEMDNCELVQIYGRIDSYTAPLLTGKLNEITIRNQYNIILDFQEVSFVSSAGLRILINFQKKCKTSKGELILLNVPQRILETLELAGFAPLFKFYSDANSAIEYF